jgi:uncharacterized membrane-anchored protein
MSPRWYVLIGAALTLFVVNLQIWRKESIVRSGASIYLALAPVDPRSLMQGDYMTLRFALAGEIPRAEQREGQFYAAPIAIDERGIARYDERGGTTIRYRWRSGEPWLGTNAYFFEEGTAERYAAAQFGEFRFDASSGDAVLVALCDEQLRRL